MATTTFNGPVRSEKGFQVATKNTSTGAITTRMSSGMPDLTGLSISDVATATSYNVSSRHYFCNKLHRCSSCNLYTTCSNSRNNSSLLSIKRHYRWNSYISF
jgi:hypothetical protein